MTPASATSATTTLTADELAGLDAYWRAANYLSVGQIYLLDNPLLREPLRATRRRAARSLRRARGGRRLVQTREQMKRTYKIS